MLRDSVVVVVVVVVRTRPRAIPLAMITMRKSTHMIGFLFFPIMPMGLCWAALRAAGSSAKNTGKERKVTNHNTVLHEEVPACTSILKANEAGFHHCCVFYATVGTQTDEPMDLNEKKFQELYFVVYICLLFIFAMLHDMKVHVQEKANLKKETLQLRYLMEHSCFDISKTTLKISHSLQVLQIIRL